MKPIAGLPTTTSKGRLTLFDASFKEENNARQADKTVSSRSLTDQIESPLKRRTALAAISMSDSELSDAPSRTTPPDSDLEGALRKQVRDALKAGNHETITISSVRKAAEEALGLEAGFYKQNQRWKEESKRIVHESFDERGADQSSPPKSKAQGAKPLIASSKKRASPNDDDGVKKKRRKSRLASSSEEALSPPPRQLNDEDKQATAPKSKVTKSSKGPPPRSKPAKSKTDHKSETGESDSELSDANGKAARPINVEASDSELSVLIDSEPPPKKKKRKSSSAPPEKGGRKPTSVPSKPKSNPADIDPDFSEIKRLQSWLVKCGIRKLWGRELKPYDTPNAKIKHLKDMLADAGMTGRYSLEKASQIKEQRELRADIEAVKEGAERWGMNVDAEEVRDGGGDSGDGDERGKPKRRLVRGAQVLDFLSSDDGEETD